MEANRTRNSGFANSRNISFVVTPAAARSVGGKLHAGAERDQGDSGQKHDPQLHLPSQAQVRHADAQQSADHQSTRPPRVNRVETAGFVIGIERRNQRIHHRLDQAPSDAGHQRAHPQDGVDAAAGGQVAGEDHHQHAERKEHSGKRQQQAHPDVIQHRAADGDGHGEAQKRQAQNAGDHFRRVGFIDGVEKHALQIGGRVRAQCGVDPGHGERQRACYKQAGCFVLTGNVSGGAGGR